MPGLSLLFPFWFDKFMGSSGDWMKVLVINRSRFVTDMWIYVFRLREGQIFF